MMQVTPVVLVVEEDSGGDEEGPVFVTGERRYSSHDQ